MPTFKSLKSYVDIDTGEIISEREAKKNYVTTKKDKYVYHIMGQKGVEYWIDWIYNCKRSTQAKLFGEDAGRPSGKRCGKRKGPSK